MTIPVCHKPSMYDRNSEPFSSLKHSAADTAVVTALSVFWQVNPIPYYESCVSDFCGCDSVGDCECFCTSVAAYSRSCSRAGVCINWRTPAICRKYCAEMHPERSGPCAQAHRGCRIAEHLHCYACVTEQAALFIVFVLLKSFKQNLKIVPAQCLRPNVLYSFVPAVFCDYYNPPDKHEWFYKPCGAPCLRTCRNPQGKCGNLLYSLEGNSFLTLMQFMGVAATSLD